MSFGVAILLVIAWGIAMKEDVLSGPDPFFLIAGLVCVVGQVVSAHLAFNQYKTLSTQTPNEGEENDRGDEQSADGFDD